MEPGLAYGSELTENNIIQATFLKGKIKGEEVYLFREFQ